MRKYSRESKPKNVLKIQKAKVKLPKSTLVDFFKAAPYPEVELDIERSNDTERPYKIPR